MSRYCVVVVSDCNPVYHLRGRVERHQPQGVDSQAPKVVKPPGQAREIAGPVAVGIQPRRHVGAVDDGVLPPQIARGLVCHADPTSPRLSPNTRKPSRCRCLPLLTRCELNGRTQTNLCRFQRPALDHPGRRRPMVTLTHRRKIVPALAASVLAAVITAGVVPATAQARTEKTNMTNRSGQPWRHPGQPPGVRAGDLLAALS